MLSDAIKKYVKAKRENDTKEMDRIEKLLAKVGMDRQTLMVVIKEMEEETR